MGRFNLRTGAKKMVFRLKRSGIDGLQVRAKRISSIFPSLFSISSWIAIVSLGDNRKRRHVILAARPVEAGAERSQEVQLPLFK